MSWGLMLLLGVAGLVTCAIAIELVLRQGKPKHRSLADHFGAAREGDRSADTYLTEQQQDARDAQLRMAAQSGLQGMFRGLGMRWMVISPRITQDPARYARLFVPKGRK